MGKAVDDFSALRPFLLPRAEGPSSHGKAPGIQGQRLARCLALYSYPRCHAQHTHTNHTAQSQHKPPHAGSPDMHSMNSSEPESGLSL